MNHAVLLESNEVPIEHLALQTRHVSGFVDFMASNGR
jgi:hypothetical protein